MSYQERLLEAIAKSQAAGMQGKERLRMSLIKHDATCPMHPKNPTYGSCNCEPDIEIVSMKEFLRRQRRGEL